MTFSKGDKVSVLDDAIDGIVISIDGSNIVIETNEGFQIKYLQKELIKIADAGILKSNIRISYSEKIASDKAGLQREFKAPQRHADAIPIFDLHIEKLVKSHYHMTKTDILILQTETAKRHIEFSIKNKIPKIVIIHGVGEGVLKAELEFLYRRYDSIIFSDASYSKYGQGATEIRFRQNLR